jgi:oxygen-dependent protoporphyrinogen oxidase
MPDVIVIGAGLSGLAAAWTLEQSGRDVMVLETLGEAGGHVRTWEQEGCLLENGPSSFQGFSECLGRLVDALGLRPDLVPAAPASRQRFVVREHQLTLLPTGPMAFLRTPLLSWQAKARLLLEPLIPNRADRNETAWNFFLRRFGPEATAYVAGPFIRGIYAGDPHGLGARAAFPKFWSFEQESGSMIMGALRYQYRKKKRLGAEGQHLPGSGLFSFQKGLGRLTQALANGLRGPLLYRCPAQSLQASDQGYRIFGPGFQLSSRQIILALPPSGAAALLRGVAPAAAACLASVPLAPVTVVHWTLPRSKNFPLGFGFLTSANSSLRVLGTLFRSQIFPGCAPLDRMLMASFYGGMLDPEAATLEVPVLQRLLLQDHALLAPAPLADVRVLHLQRHAAAIPQLQPDHPEKMAAAQAALRAVAPGIHLAGNYLTGVSMEHAAANGVLAARELMFGIGLKGDAKEF